MDLGQTYQGCGAGFVWVYELEVTLNHLPKTASIWHNKGNNNNLKGAEWPVIAR